MNERRLMIVVLALVLLLGGLILATLAKQWHFLGLLLIIFSAWIVANAVGWISGLIWGALGISAYVFTLIFFNIMDLHNHSIARMIVELLTWPLLCFVGLIILRWYTSVDQPIRVLVQGVLGNWHIYFAPRFFEFINIVESKDPYTKGHSERVSAIARKIGQQLGLNRQDCNKLWLAGLIHDIGKIGIPDYILNKPAKLSEEEFRYIQLHPIIGIEIAHSLPVEPKIKEAIYQHHERMDGKGYPNRLKGEDISLYARIIAVADAYDALTSSRAYRPAMALDDALIEIKKNAGIQFDAIIVDAIEEVLSLRKNNAH